MRRISVIIPVFNAEQSISRCLESIVSQLSEEDEILVIDDGSIDGSFLILTEYKKKYPFIRIIKQENMGVANTRNRGIKEATGKYICFIDNDDFVDEDYFNTFYKAIVENNFDMVIGGYRRVSLKKVLFSTKVVESEWYKLMFIAPWGKIFSRKFLLENQIEFLDYGIGEDIYFNFQIYQKTKKIKIIPYIGYNWWFNDESISNTDHKGFKKNIDITILMDYLYGVTSNEGLYNYYYTRFVIWYLLYSGRCAGSNDFIKEYEKDFRWLKEHKISQNILKYQGNIRGESIVNRFVIIIFMVLHKLKLVKLFSKFYCKNIDMKD